jgi:hypothetical protein
MAHKALTLSHAGEGPGLQVFPGSVPDMDCVSADGRTCKPCYWLCLMNRSITISCATSIAPHLKMCLLAAFGFCNLHIARCVVVTEHHVQLAANIILCEAC